MELIEKMIDDPNASIMGYALEFYTIIAESHLNLDEVDSTRLKHYLEDPLENQFKGKQFSYQPYYLDINNLYVLKIPVSKIVLRLLIDYY